MDEELPEVLPPATVRPCSDCPWRRESIRGWLGPMSGEEWIAMIHSDLPIACHQTIREANADGIGSWSHPAMRQCRGAAIFRENVCKSPRDPDVAVGPRDVETVFARNHEFLDHHDAPLAKWLAKQR